MPRFGKLRLALALIGMFTLAHAQPSVQTAGTLVIVPAVGEVRHANDEVRITLTLEEQDRDKTVAASRVNQKMKQGIEIVRRADPQALLATRGYYTYPIYSDEQPGKNPRLRQPISWRVGQYLDVTTSNLNALPRTVAAAQGLLALNGLQFGLTEATQKKLDEKRIEVTYRNLTERVAAIAKAMGRNVSEAVLDTVDFDDSGAYAQHDMATTKMTMRAANGMESALVEEPSLEQGETILQLRVVGKVRFK